jgi:hypothetical protein
MVLVNDGTNKESYITVHTKRVINRPDPAALQDIFGSILFFISFNYVKEIEKFILHLFPCIVLK